MFMRSDLCIILIDRLWALWIVGAVDFNSTNVNSSQTVSTMRTSTSLEVNLPSSYGNGNQHSTGTTLRERGRRGGKDLTINDNESRRNNAAKNRRRASRKNHSAGGSSFPVVFYVPLMVAVLLGFGGSVTFLRYYRRKAKYAAKNTMQKKNKVSMPQNQEYDNAYQTDLHALAAEADNEAEGAEQSTLALQKKFERDLRRLEEFGVKEAAKHQYGVLNHWLKNLHKDIHDNKAQEDQARWVRPYLLLEGNDGNDDDGVADGENEQEPDQQRVENVERYRRAKEIRNRIRKRNQYGQGQDEDHFFHVKREYEEPMAWEHEWNQMDASIKLRGPAVDYTDPKLYVYPPLRTEPPPDLPGIDYPLLKPLGELFENWPQDEDFDFTAKEGETGPRMIHEQLMHFNFSIPEQMEAAVKFRDAHLPFKVTNVPDLIAANAKWTDEYLSLHFDGLPPKPQRKVRGHAQESPTNYFAFFNPAKWDVVTMGVPPSRNSDWTFERWTRHSRYADAVRLPPNQPHFYWQAGVDRGERHEDKSIWSAVSTDLPSLSSPDENFFVFHPEAQKGIQCRFGERGVTAATHYDGGQNMVGMITGAKRYILSPPNQCSKLGIFTTRKSSIYRHSLLNLDHVRYLSPSSNHSIVGMSSEERAALQRAATAKSVETVLKSGEVLFIPSFWFHYITSLQKSAQCNVRSGVDEEATKQFGNLKSVEKCTD